MPLPPPPPVAGKQDEAQVPRSPSGQDSPPRPPPIPGTPDVDAKRGHERSEQIPKDDMARVLDETLLPKHRNDPNIILFIVNYMKCRVATQAARETGLKPSAGENLLNRPDVYSAIVKLTNLSARKFGYDIEEVIERVKEQLNVDPAECFLPDGSIKPIDQIPEAVRRAIKKFKVKELWGEDPNGMRIQEGRIVDIEFWSKEKAAELLGKEKGHFKDTIKHEHDVTERMGEILLGGKQRAEERRRLMAAERPQLPEPRDVTPVGDGDGKTDT